MAVARGDQTSRRRRPRVCREFECTDSEQEVIKAEQARLEARRKADATTLTRLASADMSLWTRRISFKIRRGLRL